LNTPSASEPSTTGSGKVKADAKPLSGTQKSRATTKRAFQDVFAEGSVKENEMLERLGTQKHERALGEQELKRRKLEQKVIERQHQREQHQREVEREQREREREREQHEYRMLQMRMVMLQRSQGAPVMQNQPSFDGFGLLAELNDPTLSSASSYST